MMPKPLLPPPLSRKLRAELGRVKKTTTRQRGKLDLVQRHQLRTSDQSGRWFCDTYTEMLSFLGSGSHRRLCRGRMPCTPAGDQHLAVVSSSESSTMFQAAPFTLQLLISLRWRILCRGGNLRPFLRDNSLAISLLQLFRSVVEQIIISLEESSHVIAVSSYLYQKIWPRVTTCEWIP